MNMALTGLNWSLAARQVKMLQKLDNLLRIVKLFIVTFILLDLKECLIILF